jgi:Ohr subfamily peroxiredoxin
MRRKAMARPLYTARARVTGGRDGRGRTDDGLLEVDLRRPKELGGDGDGTNPEHLFAVGYAACFSTVLTLLGRSKQLDAEEPVIDSAVILVPIGNGAFKLGAELDISLPAVADPGQAADLVWAAHQVCPYSNATRGNIEVAMVVNGVEL